MNWAFFIFVKYSTFNDHNPNGFMVFLAPRLYIKTLIVIL